MKKVFLASISIILSFLMLCISASSAQIIYYGEETCRDWIWYYYYGTEEEWSEFEDEYLFIAGGQYMLSVSEDLQASFRKQENWVLSVSYRDFELTKNDPYYTSYFNCYFVLKDGREYTALCDAYVRTSYTIKELIELSGIENPEDIVFVFVRCKQYNGIEITDYKFTPYKKGWNEIDNKQYYIKSDGTMITKSCKIGGVRYKFTSDGVCEGKYTGWTKSSNGRRYWKDGILIRNRYLRTKSGTRYYADENGYVTVCD